MREFSEIYLKDDELPKSCLHCGKYYWNCSDGVSCEYANCSEIYANFSEIDTTCRHRDCSFKSLSEYSKEKDKQIAELQEQLKNAIVPKGNKNGID